jgi:hypothetical protein
MTVRAVLASVPLLVAAAIGFTQSRTMSEGPRRMEVMLDRLQGDTWKSIDPALVLDPGDRVRFRFRTNFDGYLYVTNHSTSGNYEQLFPREETGEDNRITAGTEYQIPATSTVFKIAGPAGHEVVYWLVAPERLTGGAPTAAPAKPSAPLKLSPRCDDSVLRARGDCVDNSAGLKLAPRGEQNPRDLLVMRSQNTAVVSSPAPLTGPVIYEFHLAHR